MSLQQIRGLSQLTIDASRGITDVVEALHGAIGEASRPLGEPVSRTRGLTNAIYGTVRGTMGLVGGVLDLAFRVADGWMPTESGSPMPAWQAALNGVYGDHLEHSANPLSIPMRLIEGRKAPLQNGTVLAIHGLCLDETSWNHRGHDHARHVADENDRSLLYLRYNTGLGISPNGQRLADLLETQWATQNADGWLDVLAHSMGGLVIRQAMEYGLAHGHLWPHQVRRVVCLGTPHAGAPLERMGYGIDQLLGISPYTAPFGRLGGARSQGIMDLRHGLPESRDLAGFSDRFFAVAGITGSVSNLNTPGDGLVPVDSALDFPASTAEMDRTLVVEDAGHFDLLSNDRIIRHLSRWLS